MSSCRGHNLVNEGSPFVVPVGDEDVVYQRQTCSNAGCTHTQNTLISRQRRSAN